MRSPGAVACDKPSNCISKGFTFIDGTSVDVLPDVSKVVLTYDHIWFVVRPDTKIIAGKSENIYNNEVKSYLCQIRCSNSGEDTTGLFIPLPIVSILQHRGEC